MVVGVESCGAGGVGRADVGAAERVRDAIAIARDMMLSDSHTVDGLDAPHLPCYVEEARVLAAPCGEDRVRKVLLSWWMAVECVYGVFVPLYSCLRTLREWYRSQNCNIGSTTTTH